MEWGTLRVRLDRWQHHCMVTIHLKAVEAARMLKEGRNSSAIDPRRSPQRLPSQSDCELTFMTLWKTGMYSCVASSSTDLRLRRIGAWGDATRDMMAGGKVKLSLSRLYKYMHN